MYWWVRPLLWEPCLTAASEGQYNVSLIISSTDQSCPQTRLCGRTDTDFLDFLRLTAVGGRGGGGGQGHSDVNEFVAPDYSDDQQ